MTAFWHTGVHRKTESLVKFSPLGVTWDGPGGGGVQGVTDVTDAETDGRRDGRSGPRHDLRVLVIYMAPSTHICHRNQHSIGGRSAKKVYSDPQNNVVFGRFQRQRFFIKNDCKIRRQLV